MKNTIEDIINDYPEIKKQYGVSEISYLTVEQIEKLTPSQLLNLKLFFADITPEERKQYLSEIVDSNDITTNFNKKQNTIDLIKPYHEDLKIIFSTPPINKDKIIRQTVPTSRQRKVQKEFENEVYNLIKNFKSKDVPNYKKLKSEDISNAFINIVLEY